MDRAVIVGNCQAKALEMMLYTNEEFAKRFEFVSFPAVHELPAEVVPELHKTVADAALVILQRIDDNYRDGLGVGTETLASIASTANVVRWPSVFWAGYFPDLFYFRDPDGQVVVDGPFDYHDRTILEAYSDGIDVTGTCRLLEDLRRPSNAQVWADRATAELDDRGRDCDVQVTNFIESRFRDELLFFTMNHPTNRMLGFIAHTITELIGVHGGVDHLRVPGEFLGQTFYPLHPNHALALKLSFATGLISGNSPFKIRGITYGSEQAVEAFFSYYAAHPELTQINVEDAADKTVQPPTLDRSKQNTIDLATKLRVMGRRLKNRGWLRLPENRAIDHVVKPVPYLAVYEQLLASLRRRAFTLLELGVYGGHSLEMWRDAFPRATIIGIDLVPPDLDLGKRVHIVRGDQTDAGLIQEIREKYAPRGFDVVVDDASHIGVTTARSLQAIYKSHLRQGGLYCIEDWGTGYMPDWHDGGPLATRLDVEHLDNAAIPVVADSTASISMPSHDFGMVGVVKRLIDHAASGTIQVIQKDAIGETLQIESVTVWNGIVALRKPAS